MTTQEAISFLSKYQPLPSDSDLSDNIAILEQFDDIRKFFIVNPDAACIPLFLNSFGDWDGLGIYQLVEDVITKFPPHVVALYLYQSLQSKSCFIQYWSVQIAQVVPDKSLIKPLSELLCENSDDVKFAAIAALECIGGEDVINVLHNYMLNELNEALKNVASEAIHGIKRLL